VLPALDWQQLTPAPQAARPPGRDCLAAQGLGRSIEVVAGEQWALVGRVQTDQPASVIPRTGKTTLEVVERRAGAAFAQAKRWTKASAVSATSFQPLSMVSAWPRPVIFLISVTPALRF